MLTLLTNELQRISTLVPLPVFITIGAFIEEIIAPIPSLLVMTIGGSLAEVQGAPFTTLLVLAIIGAASKTFGSFLLYLITDKLEDVVIGKFGGFIGIDHKKVEQLGRHLSGGIRDDIVIFLARAIPIIPTAPVSVVCGVLKMPLRSFLLSSFLGVILRNLFYLYVGYAGAAGYASIMHSLESIESLMTITIALVLIIGAAAFWYVQNKDRLVDFISEKTLKK